ncbi:MAG: hypothetical protein GY870_12865 [archaeon]|nr:hypothetical protein [archaeon]
MKNNKISLKSLDKSNKRLKDSLKIIYGITDLECEIINFLLSEQKFICMKALESSISRPRTTIQRCLSNLIENKLIFREKRNLNEYIEICAENGLDSFIPSTDRGYRFVYKSITKENLKKQLLKDSKNGFSLIENTIHGL